MEEIYEIPVCGPNALGMAYHFNSVVGLDDDLHQASLESEVIDDDKAHLSRMLLTKDNVSEMEELLGCYPLDCYHDDQSVCSFDDDFRKAFYSKVLQLANLDESSDDIWEDSSDGEYDDAYILQEFIDRNGYDSPGDIGKFIYNQLQVDNEIDVEDYEGQEQLAICVLRLTGVTDIDMAMVKEVVAAIIESDSESEDSESEGEDPQSPNVDDLDSEDGAESEEDEPVESEEDEPVASKKRRRKKKSKSRRGRDPTTKRVRFNAIGALMDGETFQGIESDDKDEDGCKFTGDKPSPIMRTTNSTPRRRVTKSWDRLTKSEQKRAGGYGGQFGLQYIVRAGRKIDNGPIIGKYNSLSSLRLSKDRVGGGCEFKEEDVVNGGHEYKRKTGSIFITIYNEEKDGKWESIEHNQAKIDSYKQIAGGPRRDGGAPGSRSYLVYAANNNGTKGSLLRKCETIQKLRLSLSNGGIGDGGKNGEDRHGPTMKKKADADGNKYYIWREVFYVVECTKKVYDDETNDVDIAKLKKICAKEKKKAEGKGGGTGHYRTVDSWKLNM